MEITFPLKGKKTKINTERSGYAAEVVTFGFIAVARVGDEVVIVTCPDGEDNKAIFAIPTPLWDHFTLRDEPVSEVATVVTASVDTTAPKAGLEVPLKPTTPEEAKGYIRFWKELGYPKPGGAIYRLSKKAPSGAAARVVEALEQNDKTRVAKAK